MTRSPAPVTLGLCAAALLAAPAAAGQDVIAVRAGRVVDVERGRVLADQVILVRGERIHALQPAAAPIPDGAQVIDLSGHTLVPGLIDLHTHLLGRTQSASEAAPLEQTGAEDVLLGVKHARATLLAGFTTVRDIGAWRAFTDVALRDAIAEGIVPGPRMMVAGAYVTVTSGAGEITGIAPDVVVPRELRFGVANSKDEVRERVRAILNGGADFIKILATGAVLTGGTKPGAPEYTEEEIRAAVQEAANYGAHVAAHAHGAEGIQRAVRAGVRSIEHGSLLDDEGIALMKRHGTYLVADIWNGDYIAEVGAREGWSAEALRKNEETMHAQREGFRKAVAAGVKIAYGTDSGVYPHGWNAKQLPVMVRYGMTPMQAIQAATIEAARMMRWDDRVGSIAPGKYADLIAVEGDALADLARFEDVAFVMKGGVVYKAP